VQTCFDNLMSVELLFSIITIPGCQGLSVIRGVLAAGGDPDAPDVRVPAVVDILGPGAVYARGPDAVDARAAAEVPGAVDTRGSGRELAGRRMGRAAKSSSAVCRRRSIAPSRNSTRWSMGSALYRAGCIMLTKSYDDSIHAICGTRHMPGVGLYNAHHIT